MHLHEKLDCIHRVNAKQSNLQRANFRDLISAHGHFLSKTAFVIVYYFGFFLFSKMAEKEMRYFEVSRGVSIRK